MTDKQSEKLIKRCEGLIKKCKDLDRVMSLSKKKAKDLTNVEVRELRSLGSRVRDEFGMR